jgi:thiol-disulfide isomerase/thioredoxin
MHEEKPVLVNFWFPSCPPCRAEMPDLQAAFEKYGDEVAFIGIQQLGLDSPASGAAFVEELGLTYPSMPDTNSKVQFAYEVFSYPTTVFLNRNHDIARTWTGIIGEEQLAEQLEALLAG